MKINPILLYEELFDYFGPQNWWPIDQTYHNKCNSDPRFEVIVGAILTQNTAWENVEKALSNLKKKSLLNIHDIHSLDIDELKKHINPSGFFNQKAQRLKIISDFILKNYDGQLNVMFLEPPEELRVELLSLNGIGPETADSILLYAGKKPVFVVDAYTKRLCKRIPFPIDNSSYDAIQNFFQESCEIRYDENNLVNIYNEYHAVIVELAKQFCTKKNPLCSSCPIKQHCSYIKED